MITTASGLAPVTATAARFTRKAKSWGSGAASPAGDQSSWKCARPSEARASRAISSSSAVSSSRRTATGAGVRRRRIDQEIDALGALREAGVTLDQLCALTGAREKEVTAEFVGRRTLSERTVDALRGLLAPHQAEEIAALIGGARAAYLEEVQAGRL